MKSLSAQTVFGKIDLGTVVTTSSMDVIDVTVDTEKMMHDYGDAILHELERRNPMKYNSAVKQLLQETGFDSEFQAIHYYVDGLTSIRIQSISGKCPDWRAAKSLVMTAVLQDALSCLGVIIDRAHGYKVVPHLKNVVKYSVVQLQHISEFIEWFEDDGLHLFKDAIPRGEEGDVDTMSCVIVGDEIKSMKVDAHPAFSYIAAFLGLEAQSPESLSKFDVRYDIFGYVKSALLAEVRKCSF